MKQIHWIWLVFTTAFLLIGCEKELEIESSQQAAELGLMPTLIIRGDPVPGMKLAERMAQYHVPGVSIAVIHEGKVEWAKGYGVAEAGTSNPVRATTGFQAASISKLITAMLVLTFVQSGELDLDRDVNQYLKSWNVPDNEFTQENKVTLRGILSHTAGLTVDEFIGYPAESSIPTLIQMLNGQPPANNSPIRVSAPPGKAWNYSGGGYVLVQLLLEDLTGKTFPQLAKERIFVPLGMNNSTFEQLAPESWAGTVAIGHDGAMRPLDGKWYRYPEMAAAGLWTTPSDLARLAIEVQYAAAGDPHRMLSPEMARELLTPSLGNSGLGAFVRTNKVYSWMISGGSTVGFRCFMTVFMESGQGAIVMTNGENGQHLAMEIIRGISQFFNWPDFLVQEKTLAPLNPDVYNAYLGEYEFLAPPGLSVMITRNATHLQADLFGSIIELHPESETIYFELNTGLSLTFVKADDGQVQGLLLSPPLAPHPWQARKMN